MYELTEQIKLLLRKEYEKGGYSIEYYPYFEWRYRQYMMHDEDCDDTSLEGSYLELSKQYMDIFIKQVNIGHSLEWAERYAFCWDENNSIDSVYSELAIINKRLAIREIQIHAKIYGKDPYFEGFFVELLSEYGNHYSDEEIERYASNYSKLYQQEIASGKSVCYAKRYAESAAFDKYVEEYCRIMADIYEYAENQSDCLDLFSFASDCADIYSNENWFSESEKLRDKYQKDWQQKYLDILTDQYKKSDHVMLHPRVTKRKSSSITDDTLEMMFPDGIDDGFTGIVKEE